MNNGTTSREIVGLCLYAVLVSSCETGIKPTAVVTAADSADQVLFNMSHYVTAEGIQGAHVLADTAYCYSPTQTAEPRNVHITFLGQRRAETSALPPLAGT